MPKLFSYYITFWKRAFDFKGVADRKQFIASLLMNAGVFVALNACAIAFFELGNSANGGYYFIGQMLSALGAIYLIAQIAPVLSLMVRRLHDHNDPWWYMFLAVNPIGILVLIVFFCLKTVTVNNRWRQRDIERGNLPGEVTMSLELAD